MGWQVNPGPEPRAAGRPPTDNTHNDSFGMTSPLQQRVLRALATSRQTKRAFPGSFLAFTGRHTGKESLELTLADDPLWRDAAGELNCCVLGAMVDPALGGVSDHVTGPRIRPATAHIQLQLTGASTRGDLRLTGEFVGYSDRSPVRKSFTRANLYAGGALLGHAMAANVLFDLPEDNPRAPFPWMPPGFRLDESRLLALEEPDRNALTLCERAEQAATPELPFIEHFWCGPPQLTGEGTASLRAPVTPHLGNRIGHVQGGLLLGVAMKVAIAAAAPRMRLSSISAYFVSPGLAPHIDIQSEVVQSGRSLAVVQTRITGANGKLVLHAASQHVLA